MSFVPASSAASNDESVFKNWRTEKANVLLASQCCILCCRSLSCGNYIPTRFLARHNDRQSTKLCCVMVNPLKHCSTIRRAIFQQWMFFSLFANDIYSVWMVQWMEMIIIIIFMTIWPRSSKIHTVTIKEWKEKKKEKKMWKNNSCK